MARPEGIRWDSALDRSLDGRVRDAISDSIQAQPAPAITRTLPARSGQSSLPARGSPKGVVIAESLGLGFLAIG